MDASTEKRRVPVVVFDDGSLTRGGLQRVARYASDAALLGGVRGPALARVLEDLGIPVRELDQPGAAVTAAAQLAAERAAVLVTGAPLEPQPWLTAVGTAAGDSGRCGLVVHVPDPSPVGSVRVAALTAQARSWTGPVGAAFGTAAGLHADTSATGSFSPADAGRMLEAGGSDHLLVCAAVPYPEPEQLPAAHPEYAVSAADTVLAVLTDTALVLTNRSPVGVRVRVRLGAAGHAAQDLGAMEAELAPGETGAHALADAGFLAGLEPPHGVVRHWSHETETVYEGGTMRINGLDIRFLAPGGETLALGSYGSRQGLHVGVNSTELGQVLGSTLTSAAGEYERMAARRGAALADLLGLLAAPREQTPVHRPPSRTR